MVDAQAVRSESRRSAGGDCNWRGAVKSKQLMAVQSERGEEGERKQMVPVRNQVRGIFTVVYIAQDSLSVPESVHA